VVHTNNHTSWGDSTTPDEDFVLDRVGPVVVVSACSGHGAKFTPLVGSLAADLALGSGVPDPRFALPVAV
jgi:sarcosine oxidase